MQRAGREAHPSIGEHDVKPVMRTIAGSVFVVTSRHMDDLAGMTDLVDRLRGTGVIAGSALNKDARRERATENSGRRRHSDATSAAV